jgi:chemotaxis protein methyltransferase CheR
MTLTDERKSTKGAWMAWTDPLREDQWRRLRAALREWSGMECPDNRRADLRDATLKAAKYAGGIEFETLLAKLQDPKEEALRGVWLSAYTIHETYFFRDAPQWKAIRERVIPERIEARRATKTLKIWSAGCSTGEEAYTAAIVVRQLLPDAGWTVRIVGTDISTDVLAKARKGQFREWAFRQTPLHVRDDCFENVSSTIWKIHDDFARSVRFEALNLKTGTYPSRSIDLEDLDLILCRNVLIYFERTEMDKVITRLTDCLAPGGYLALGPAEPFPPSNLPLESLVSDGATLYRRKLAETLAPEPLITPAAHRTKAMPSRAVNDPYDQPKRPDLPKSMTASSTNAATSALIRPGPAPRIDPKPAPDQKSKSEQAHMLADAGRWEDALVAADEAIAAGPFVGELFYLRALALKELGRLDESRDALRKCLYLEKTHWMAHLLAAGLWQREGAPDRAKSHLTAILDGLATLAPADVLPGTGGINVGRMRALADSQLKHLEGRN